MGLFDFTNDALLGETGSEVVFGRELTSRGARPIRVGQGPPAIPEAGKLAALRPAVNGARYA